MKMKIALALLPLLFLFTATVQAEDAVMPPPTDVKDTPQAKETVQPQEKAPNLSEEFKTKKSDDRVQVYSYQRDDGAQIEEYSMHGHVYMIKVQPPGNMPPYYLYDDTGEGNFRQHDGSGRQHISPPMWVIKRF